MKIKQMTQTSIAIDGDWTDKIDTVRKILNMPSETICLPYYNDRYNITKIYTSLYEEKEVNTNGKV